jgi:hypothetical protein
MEPDQEGFSKLKDEKKEWFGSKFNNSNTAMRRRRIFLVGGELSREKRNRQASTLQSFF